jgi:hypothetical protein
MFLIFMSIAIVVVWGFVLFLRPYLITKYPAYGKYAETETALFNKSRTILISRLYWIGGLLIGIQSLAASAGLNITPFIDELSKAIPEGYRPLAIAAFLFVTGVCFEWLRKNTTSPIEDQTVHDDDGEVAAQ